MIDLLDPTRIYFKNFENVSEVVDFMSKRLIQDGLAEKGVTQSIKEREKIASTAFTKVWQYRTANQNLFKKSSCRF
ncbi:hypothetical protein S101258_00975 [Lactiplantibacillus plantarum subsp. plantarum]|uniref:Uncharacterized protein n=1 Tax=Lactiplantibacillus plantarum subsp. plantarum TaxID=337330 RepID=A0A2S3U8B1_LACPN|nr:hypothetical protein S101258_00975 [Lactiplantibacillus plantarum subsp. plantarum]